MRMSIAHLPGLAKQGRPSALARLPRLTHSPPWLDIGNRRGIVRITAQRRHWTKNVERLCGAELAPLGESGGTVQLEIFAAVEMALLIEMIVYG